MAPTWEVPRMWEPYGVLQRVGHGSSYCLSVKFGLVKGEYILDHNTGAGTVFFRFGERFGVQFIRPL
jgi:hypothetical protein